jgi:hypothetical protein
MGTGHGSAKNKRMVNGELKMGIGNGRVTVSLINKSLLNGPFLRGGHGEFDLSSVCLDPH